MMRQFGTALGASAAAVLVLVACGNESGAKARTNESGPTVNPSDNGSSVPTPGGAAPTGTPGGTAVEQATADLVKKLGVPGVRVVSSEEVTWSDGSLGCPEEGMRYTQALVNGMRIILEADGKKYEYHSGGSRAPFLCENPQAR